MYICSKENQSELWVGEGCIKWEYGNLEMKGYAMVYGGGVGWGGGGVGWGAIHNSVTRKQTIICNLHGAFFVTVKKFQNMASGWLTAQPQINKIPCY